MRIASGLSALRLPTQAAEGHVRRPVFKSMQPYENSVAAQVAEFARNCALQSRHPHLAWGSFCRHECIWCVRACEGRSGGAGPYDQFLMPHCETSNARTFSVQTDYCSSSSQGRDKRGIAFLTGPAFGHTKASIQAASVGVYSIAG